MTLTEAAENVGAIVLREWREDEVRFDFGQITSVNDRVIFVRYGGDEHSKATMPEELNLLSALCPCCLRPGKTEEARAKIREAREAAKAGTA